MPNPILAEQRAALDRLDALEREASALHAARARAMSAIEELWDEDPNGRVVEVAGTCRVGQARAHGTLSRDTRLVHLFPVALGLLEAGVMRVGTVQIVLEVTRNATSEVQRLLDQRCSELVCLMDAVDVRRRVAAAVLEIEAELDDLAQRERLEQARADRGVWVKPVEDGMARIGAEVTALAARRWLGDFEELVRAQKVLDDRNGVRRTQSQRRADVFAELPSRVIALARAATTGRLEELLETVPLISRGDAAEDELALGLPTSGRARWWERDADELVRGMLGVPLAKPCTLLVHIAMTTLLDLDQRSGWADGIGPIPALHARMLLPTAALRRVAVDERTGVPLAMDPQGAAPAWRAPWDGEIDPPAGGGHDRSSEEPPPPETPPPPDGGADDGGGPGGPPPGGRDAPRRVRSLAEHARDSLIAMLGLPMYVDDRVEEQYAPSTALRTTARVRDVACDGPGCPRAARSCELDHEHDHAQGGPTALWNLRHRSTRCHHVKHAGWTVAHDAGTATTTWSSPAGSTYHRRSVWQAPLPLPGDLVLPGPRLVLPQDVEPSWYRLAREEHDLWHEAGPREKQSPSPESSSRWDEGPPPF